MQTSDGPAIMKSVPPSPDTSEEFSGQPTGIILHGGDKKKPHSHFRCIPTRQCSVMTAAIVIVMVALSMAISMIFLGVGDNAFAYTTIGSILSVALVYLKPSSSKVTGKINKAGDEFV
jgi:hypothetical protein